MAEDLKKIKQEIEALQKKAEALVEKEKASVIEDMRNKIEDYGITAKDLGLSRSRAPSSSAGKPVPVKYKKGSNAWSGRGRKPRWVEDHIAKGGKVEDLLVK